MVQQDVDAGDGQRPHSGQIAASSASPPETSQPRETSGFQIFTTPSSA
jgi:hypothetical protein